MNRRTDAEEDRHREKTSQSESAEWEDEHGNDVMNLVFKRRASENNKKLLSNIIVCLISMHLLIMISWGHKMRADLGSVRHARTAQSEPISSKCQER